MGQRPTPHVTCILLNPTIDHVHEVEHFKAGGTYKATATRVFPVGKAISVALGMRVLGDEPTVIALVGRDEARIYSNSLDEAGISATLVPVDGRTRRNVTVVDTAERTVTHVREGGFTANDGHLDGIVAGIDRLPRVTDRWVVLSGSVPPGLPEDTIARITAGCKARGMKVLLDVSGPPLKAAMRGSKPWVLKINDTELDYLLGRSEGDAEHGPARGGDAHRAARDAGTMLGGGLEAVAITMGAAGAVLVTAGGAWHGEFDAPASIDVANTVGAGDAFFAGMIHAMAGGIDDATGILVEAISCATAKLLVHGAGAFPRDDQRRFRARVRVRRVG